MTVSFKRLKPATLARYEEAEKNGTLTPRQRTALEGHRALPGAVNAMKEEAALRLHRKDLSMEFRVLELGEWLQGESVAPGAGVGVRFEDAAGRQFILPMSRDELRALPAKLDDVVRITIAAGPRT